MAAQMANQMLQLRYGRKDESQSDEYGLRMMEQAGYDPRAMLDVMKILKAAGGGGRMPEWMSSHPLPETRLEEIGKELKENYPKAGTESLGRGRSLKGSDWK